MENKTSQRDNKRPASEIVHKSNSMWKWVVCIVVVIGIFVIYKDKFSNPSESELQSGAVPSVSVEYVKQYDASVKESEFVGRVEAIQSVDIKPQISGKIAKVCFAEGSFVKEGQLLYEIDPQEYQATVQVRKAELEQAKANLATAEKYYKRTKATNSRAISATDKDTAEGNYLQAKAAVSQATANLKLAEIDLGYCKIKSPISGKIGKTYYTKGNYVTPSIDSLATVVQMDPIRVKYPLSDREYINQLSLFKQDGAVFNTRVKLSNGDDYTVSGKREFEDNTVDTTTGTVMMNIAFENKDGLLIPGEMVRVYTKNITSEMVKVIPQTAVMADSQGDFVYVISDNKVAERRVSLGREFDFLREVTDGLEEGEKVVVAGLQNIRDGVEVTTVKLPDITHNEEVK